MEKTNFIVLHVYLKIGGAKASHLVWDYLAPHLGAL